jgi:biopolymer transport protein ExbD
MAGGVGGDEEEYIQLNLTAMVDVVMLLIIFFVSNLKFPQEEGALAANLPKAGVRTKDPNIKPPTIDKVVIGIDKPGKDIRVIVNSQPVGGLDALNTKLFLLQRQIPDAEVTLDVRPDVPYEYVVQVFNLCARNRFTKVAFAQPAQTP